MWVGRSVAVVKLPQAVASGLFSVSLSPIFNFFVWMPLASYGAIRQKESWAPMASYGAERVNFSI